MKIPGKPIIRLPLVARLAALSLFLSAVEFLIPRLIPSFRLGLANLVFLIGLSVLSLPELGMLLLLKVLLQGLIQGSLFSPTLILSLCASTSSLLIMSLLYRIRGKWLGLAGISMAGALASNVVQLLLARVILFGAGTLFLAPPLLLIGTFSALPLGLFAEDFTRRSRWLKQL